MADIMKGSFYLVIRKGRYWQELKARLTSSEPQLAADERVLKLTVAVPRAIFSTPTLQATVTIPEDAVGRPVVDAQVIDNVREIIQQQTGLCVSVAVVEPTEVAEPVLA